MSRGVAPRGSPLRVRTANVAAEPALVEGSQVTENPKLASGLDPCVPARPVLMSTLPVPNEPSDML